MESYDLVSPLPSRIIKPKGRSYFIRVKNQKEFDELNGAINGAINSGRKNIKVLINRGIYHFHQNHILLKDINAQSVFISLEGEGVVIVSDIHKNMRSNIASSWGEMFHADTLIEVVDKEHKICFIPYRNSIDKSLCSNYSKVQIPQWYKAPVYDVLRLDGDGVYFLANELDIIECQKRRGYSINYDFLYNGEMPRFRLFNASMEESCSSSCFLYVNNCSFLSLRLSGLRFCGNNQNASLVSLIDNDTKQILIENCAFDNIRNSVLTASNTSNVLFTRNTVTNTAGNELVFSNGCHNVRITHNLFNQCGLELSNTMCIRSNESEYYIAHNTFCDFGYCAIGVGLWYGHEKKHLNKGIIEFNELYFSPDYLAEIWKHMLMDSGAIYIWTQNDEAIIRYNYIHDYSGAGDNRGLFCDDGASNLKIYGNVILNTPNCYSIDLRSIKDNAIGFKNNANNYMAYNIVDNGIRFEGYPLEERHNTKAQNVVLHSGKGTHTPSKFNYLENSVEDLYIGCQEVSSSGIRIEKTGWNIIRELPCYHQIKRFIKRK